MRQSIDIEGYDHGQPIPCASRTGPLLMSGGIAGLDCRAGIVPDGAEAQVREMFANVAAIMAKAGGDLSRIVKMTFYVDSKDTRAAINDEWNKAFPDPLSRPARHTMIYRDMPPGVMVQCDLTAWLGE